MISNALAAGYSPMGSAGMGASYINEAQMGDLLESLGFLYGAMGYVIDDDDSAEIEATLGDALGFLPAKMMRKIRKRAQADRAQAEKGMRASWLIREYKRSPHKRKKFMAAGLNVTERCPGGGMPKRKGQKMDRWVCFEPAQRKGKTYPYQVWDRKRGQWVPRLLNCPAGGLRPCKKGKKGFLKRVSSGIKKGVKTAAKVVKKASLMPLKFMKDIALKLLLQAALPLARAVCRLPSNVLRLGALSANVNPQKLPMFCKAVRLKNWNDVRALLPDAIKTAVKVSVTTSVPGLAPALTIAKNIPGLRKYANLAGSDPTGDLDPVYALDAIDSSAMSYALHGISDADLSDGLNGLEPKVGNVLLWGLGVGTAATGLYFATRR